jgi:hypothetical protein
MPVMQIEVVRLHMVQGFMSVPVRIRLRHWPIMGMLVMVVMRMACVRVPAHRAGVRADGAARDEGCRSSYRISIRMLDF